MIYGLLATVVSSRPTPPLLCDDNRTTRPQEAGAKNKLSLGGGGGKINLGLLVAPSWGGQSEARDQGNRKEQGVLGFTVHLPPVSQL